MNLTPADLAKLRNIIVRAVDDAHDLLATAAARTSTESSKAAPARARGGEGGNAPLPDASPPKLTYTIAEATKALGLSRSTIYNLIVAGELETLRIGRRRLLPAAAIHQLLSKSPEN